MYIARILYPVEVLGPGKRIGIWFCGCPRRCKGCSNPELWKFQDRYKVDFEVIKQLILEICDNNTVDGFTITGGEPLYQYNDFSQLSNFLSTINNDILVYTGYSINELNDKNLENIAVLIDGEYIEERNNNCVLRGSDNQQIHILNKDLEAKYNVYLSTYSNRIQNFATGDGYISVGIHSKGFKF